MTIKRYYVESEDGEEEGPFTLDELRQDKDLDASTLVRLEDETAPRPLGGLIADEAGQRAREAEKARKRAEEDLISRTGFCKSCTAKSRALASGNTRTINGVGIRFYGSAEQCRTCYSVVKVLWLVLAFIPIIPLGTYRFQEMSTGNLVRQFFTRRTHTRWPMVLSHWLPLAALLGLMALMR